jgi:hypothetical protein
MAHDTWGESSLPSARRHLTVARAIADLSCGTIQYTALCYLPTAVPQALLLGAIHAKYRMQDVRMRRLRCHPTTVGCYHGRGICAATKNKKKVHRRWADGRIWEDSPASVTNSDGGVQACEEDGASRSDGLSLKESCR